VVGEVPCAGSRLDAACHDEGRVRSALVQEDEMSDNEKRPTGEDEIELMEFETEGIDGDGNVVVDDVVVALDAHGHVLATDETVAVLTAQGDVVVEETVSIVGDDGELHVLEEDVVIVENDEQDAS
jgi:hypothetical protein